MIVISSMISIFGVQEHRRFDSMIRGPWPNVFCCWHCSRHQSRTSLARKSSSVERLHSAVCSPPALLSRSKCGLDSASITSLYARGAVSIAPSLGLARCLGWAALRPVPSSGIRGPYTRRAAQSKLAQLEVDHMILRDRSSAATAASGSHLDFSDTYGS